MNARRARASSLSRFSVRPVRFEALERRRMLSAAPVAADDAYELGPDHQLVVDLAPTPTPLAFDQTAAPPAATGPFTTADYVRVVQGGDQVTEPESVEVAAQANTYGEITVTGPGSRWTGASWVDAAREGKATITATDGGTIRITNWFQLASRGLGEMTVSNGGVVSVANFSSLGSTDTGAPGGGAATVTVTGPTSRWNNGDAMAVGYGNAQGTVRLLDDAVMSLGAGQSHAGYLAVGDNGGFGLFDVAGGAGLRIGNHTTVGGNRGRGELRVGGGGSVASANWAAVGDNAGLGTVTVAGAGSRWTIANHLTVGDNAGRGVLSISDGGSVTAANWVEIGRNNASDGRVIVGGGSTFSYREFLSIGASPAGNSHGTLYVADGGQVVNTGGQGFGRGPEIINYSGGRILGSGTVAGQVNNYGFISPGGSIGLLTIDGNLLQPAPGADPFRVPNPQGILQFDIGGTERGTSYDALDVGGTARIVSGKAVLNFVNGFAPRAGDRFVLIDAAAPATFTGGVEVRGLAPGFQYTLAAEGDKLVLTAVNDATAASTAVTRAGVLANDTDSDGDALSTVLVRRPEHGTVSLFRDGSFTYVPGPSFTGVDSFVYKADDGVFTSGPATVTVRNQAPVARDDAYAVDEDATLTVAAADGVLGNDTDSVSPTLTAQVVRAPEHGTLTLNPNGSFAYEPADGFSGTDTFTYRASDGSVQSAAATVTITVRPINSAPVANTDQAAVRQGRELVLRTTTLLANDTDSDGDTLRVTGVHATADTHGSVTLSNGRVTYRPDRRYAGPASFTYAISDGQGGTATGTVNVTVLPKHRGTPGGAIGSGTLASGRKVFQFVAHARGDEDDLSIRGAVSYRDLSRRLTLQAGEIDLFELSDNGKAVTIAGAATVNGREGYRFELRAEDKSSSGRNDRFRILISGPDGYRYDSASGTGGDRIDRGNIVILGSRGKDD